MWVSLVFVVGFHHWDQTNVATHVEKVGTRRVKFLANTIRLHSGSSRGNPNSLSHLFGSFSLSYTNQTSELHSNVDEVVEDIQNNTHQQEEQDIKASKLHDEEENDVKK